jgi:hypothetical protein
VESTLAIIDRLALGGYVWLAATLNGIWPYKLFVGGFALAGALWAVLRSLPEAGEGALWELLKWFAAAFIGMFFLYNPATNSSLLAVIPQANDKTRGEAQARAADGGVSMAAVLPLYWVERYFTVPLTQIMLEVTNPQKRALISSPSRAAARVIAEPDVGSDPQYLAARLAWREVLAPAILERAPALREKLLADGLLAAFYNPRSDVAPAGVALRSFIASLPDEKARKVATAIQASAGSVELRALLEQFEPMITDRMGGQQSWGTTATGGLNVPLLGPATLQVPLPSPVAPPDAASSQGMAAAYALGARVLTAVYNDPQRTISVGAVEDLYRAIGRAGDRAVAASLMSDPRRITMFGATCESLGEQYCPLTLNGASERSIVVDNPVSFGSTGEAGRRSVSSALGGAFLAIGSALAWFAEGVVSEGMPVVIGYMKFGLVLVSFVAPVMMMIPGYFSAAVHLLVGWPVFIGLFTTFYIVWDRVSASPLLGGSLTNPETELAWATNEGSWLMYALNPILQLAAYGLMAAIAYAIVFGGIRGAQAMMRGAGSGGGMLEGGMKRIFGGSRSSPGGSGSGPRTPKPSTPFPSVPPASSGPNMRY